MYFPRGTCIDDRADDLVFSHTEIEFVEVNSILRPLDARARAPDLFPSGEPSDLLALSLSFSFFLKLRLCIARYFVFTV